MEARQVVEIHNSNSNMEMKHGKTAPRVQELSLRVRMVWRLYLPDSTSLSIWFNIEASQQPKESVGGKELKPRWQGPNERVEVVAAWAAVYYSIWNYSPNSPRGYDISGLGSRSEVTEPQGASQNKRDPEARIDWPLIVDPHCELGDWSSG